MEQKIQVGDLVQIRKWCRDKGRFAQVVEMFSWEPNCVRIQFLDEVGLGEVPIWAQKNNLILLTIKEEEEK